MKKAKELLEDLEAQGRLIAAIVRDLRKFHEATKGLSEYEKALEDILNRARTIQADLFSLEAQAKRPYEDNSAETLRALFL